MKFFSLAIFSLFGALAEEEWSDKVVIIADDDWEGYSAKNPKFLVAFFAPWCGHCKALKPAFSEAADELQFKVPLVAVDCTDAGKVVCAQYEVTGFPTIKWFDSGEMESYEGGRSTEEFVKFVTDKVGDEPDNFDGVDFSTFKIRQLKKLLSDRGQVCAGCAEKRDFIKKVQATIHLPKSGPPQKKKKKMKGSSLVNGRTVAQERRWKEAKKIADEGWEENGDVVHLIEDDFKSFLTKKGAMFTMFYAPWCGHCKNFKPTMAEASTALKDIVAVTAVDCDSNAPLCAKYQARSYPTLTFFPDSESTGVPFEGSRTVKGLTKWLRQKFDPTYEEVVEPFDNELKWEENGAVIHLTDDHWPSYRKENPKMFVMFYAPWCGHCKAIKPDWATASIQLEGEMPMVAVDCTEHTATCGSFAVTGYPTIKYFDTSDGEPVDYNGGRTLEDLVAFAESKVEDKHAKEEL